MVFFLEHPLAIPLPRNMDALGCHDFFFGVDDFFNL
jgi:hypothetical protein